MKHAVTYGTLDMCAFGMRDPNGEYYYKPTSLLHDFPDVVAISLKMEHFININHWKVVLQDLVHRPS